MAAWCRGIGARAIVAIAGIVLAAAWQGTARADSAPPIGYDLSRDGIAVVVCPESSDASARCGSGARMLRVAKDGSSAYLLTACQPETNCWLDACPAIGDWRYGLVDPLECIGSGTLAYGEIHIEYTTDPGCEVAPQGGTPWDGPLPWDDRWVCEAAGLFGCQAGRTRVPAMVVAMDLLLAAAGAIVLLQLRRRSRR